MLRRLSAEEKEQIRAERLQFERQSFPEADIDVIVDDYTWATGEPRVRVVRRRGKDDKSSGQQRS